MANRAILGPEPPAPEESLSFVQGRLPAAEGEYVRARSALLSARAALRDAREAFLRKGVRLGKLRRVERFAMEALGLETTMLIDDYSEEFVAEYGDEIQEDDLFTDDEALEGIEDDDDDDDAPHTIDEEDTEQDNKRKLEAVLPQPSSSSSSSSGQARPSKSARVTSASRSSHNPYVSG